MKFRERPKPLEIIEAEQFLLTRRPYPAAMQRVWVDKRNPNKVLSANEQKPSKPAIKGYAVKTLGGDWLVVEYGDWIVTYADGSHFAFASDRFEAVYEPLEQPSGVEA